MDGVVVSSTANYDIPKHPVLDYLFGTGHKLQKDEFMTSFSVEKTKTRDINYVAKNNLSSILEQI